MAQESSKLNSFNVHDVFKPDGKLSEILTDYNERPEQTAMAQTIMEALVQEKHCLAEAGTGVGKSLSYLIPGIAWALKAETRLLISTHTKALQMQLIEQELPRLNHKALYHGAIRAELCLGAENYICLLRLLRLTNDKQLAGLDQEFVMGLSSLLGWCQGKVSGLRQDVPEQVPEWLWKKVNIMRELCTGRHCAYFEDCFLQQARKRQREANVLITNHSLFFANIIAEGKLLPEFGAVILDEAHKVEDVASKFLGDELAQNQLADWLHDISDNKRSGIWQELTSIPEAERVHLGKEARLVLKDMESWWQSLQKRFQSSQDALRFTDESEPLPEPNVEPLHKLATHLIHLVDITDTEEEAKGVQFLAARFEEAARIIQNWYDHQENETVYWAELLKGVHQDYCRLQATPLDMSQNFSTMVLDTIASVIFVSATMAVNKKFSYFKNRLGIQGAEEIVLDSPFPYEENAAIYLPKDMPEPRAVQEYEERLLMECSQLIDLFKGGMFILFTSYRLMRSLAKLFREQFPDETILVQGEAPPHRLLKQFQEHKNAIMLGVETFWQGVDVPGDALRCVVITRLPFDVPTHPVHQARGEYMEEQDQNPFVHYSVPRAILMLRQGFGRLIRRHNDQGVVAILDARVKSRSWGKRFIKALPDCKHLEKIEEVAEFVEERFHPSES